MDARLFHDERLSTPRAVALDQPTIGVYTADGPVLLVRNSSQSPADLSIDAALAPAPICDESAGCDAGGAGGTGYLALVFIALLLVTRQANRRLRAS